MSIYDLEAYQVIQKADLSDIKSRGTLLKHRKSGARVLLMENDDENKVFAIGFRTPPSDSTGVPHIMEHSVLCGIRKTQCDNIDIISRENGQDFIQTPLSVFQKNR